MYIHEDKNWPKFSWKNEIISSALMEIRHKQGRLLGKIEAIGFPLQSEAFLNTVGMDTIKTSEIEGEILNPDQVRSSVARHLHLDIAGLVPSDRNVDGIVEILLDATQNYKLPLTAKRLFRWHKLLFPDGFSGMIKIETGKWRSNLKTDPMQVVSGRPGRQKVHFEAPASKKMEKEMKQFLEWFNSEMSYDLVTKAAIAHLWFVTIHPFSDGNGRIARAVSDMLLTKADNVPQRFYSMSAQIRIERTAYYNILEKTQKGNLDITEWILWFLNCLNRALDASQETLASVFAKKNYWEKFSNVSLNERQRNILNKMMNGFAGKLTSSKWAKIAKCSQDSALRDIQFLLDKGMLIKEDSGGRSTSYRFPEV